MNLLSAIFIGITTIQLYFYFRYFFRLNPSKVSFHDAITEGVSVVIAAKNELHHLPNLIDAISKQKYSNFEIIIVDDYSEDGSWEWLQTQQNTVLKVYKNEMEKGKKSALALGIEKANNELLLFTDADCLPASNFWLNNMVSKFKPEVDVVLGYGAFRLQKGLLNAITQFENYLNALQYLSFAHCGKAYMGVGRNLAYRKSAFIGAGGFATHYHLLSGDDDLMVNKLAKKNNVEICFNIESHTYSDAPSSWSTYFHQKRRQLLAGNHYKAEDRIRLAIFGATNVLFYFLFVILLLTSTSQPLIIGIFVMKQVLELSLLVQFRNSISKHVNCLFFSFIEPIYLMKITFIGITTWFWKVDKWK